VRVSSYNFIANHQTFTGESPGSSILTGCLFEQGGDDDNLEAISVPAKLEIGGNSPAQVSAEKVKKARKA
ncbi:unnamed protein product, partial [Brassica rapa subsp. narinosa]